MKAVILDHYGKKDGYGLAKCQTLSCGKVESIGRTKLHSLVSPSRRLLVAGSMLTAKHREHGETHWRKSK